LHEENDDENDYDITWNEFVSALPSANVKEISCERVIMRKKITQIKNEAIIGRSN